MYTSISIDAPDSAPAGGGVGVAVRVRNTDLISHHYIATSCAVDGQDLIYKEQWFAPGETKISTGFFYMPDKSVVISAATWRWEFDHWVLDNSESQTVALEEVPEVYAGTISRKELEYDHIRSSIPVY